MKSLFFFSGICLLILSFIPTQKRTIRGKIEDEKNRPITGASIIIKGTKEGTSSDSNGDFVITVTTNKATLVVSAVGYQAKEYKLTSNDTLTIALKANSAQLNEVVAMGYGVKKKEKFTPPTIMADVELAPAPMFSSRALAGRVSGLSINNQSASKWSGNSDKQLYQSQPDSDYNREGYDKIDENPFLKTTDNPLSTFSIDVDAASYSNIRRFLNDGEMPPAGAVRIEEMINYFTYQYPQPSGDAPFSINTEMAACPWNATHKLAMIGLQGKIIPAQNLPASNLVFLIDVSGSMFEKDKLPLVQSSLKLLTDQLRPQDKVSLVAYAGNAGLVLPSTNGDKKETIKDAINRLEAGGSTAGGEGIQLAYKVAKQNFISGGNNRIILCTDGDFNVGVSSDDELERLIEKERESGVFLTVLGYGTGNYQDAKMQKLADKGNGNHAYIDGIREANKVLVHEFGGTLFTIAKDVKLQIEFNPAKVQGYRLIGYENRMLAKEDFNNDAKDAGELGSGHTVTALYEIVPVGVKGDELNSVDALRYLSPEAISVGDFGSELMNIKLRYKQPDGNKSALLQHPVVNSEATATSDNYKLATAVAQFGMLLRASAYKGNASYASAKSLANETLDNDKEGYRKELVQLIEKAAKLNDEDLTKKTR